MRQHSKRSAFARASASVIGLFLALTLTGDVFGQTAAPSESLRAKAQDADSLAAKAARPEGVRVIVTLNAASPTPATRSLPSAAIDAPDSTERSGPLQDGQPATVEQEQLLRKHVGVDRGKQRRWAPRLVRDTRYMAVTVNAAELEALSQDAAVVSVHEEGELFPGLQDSVPLIGMPAAHELNALGRNWAVAVIDTGAQYDHPFIGNERILGATCFSTGDTTFATLCPNGMNTQAGGNAGQPCAVAGQACWHGTHVAGIAMGSRATGTPRNGVAVLAPLFPVQVFRRRISDNRISAGDADMLAALADIRTRVEAGAQIASINISIWDSGAHFNGACDAETRAQPFVDEINRLRNLGVATVIISGNGSRTNQSAFPGCVGGALTVSSTDKTDVVATDANLSATVDLFAPGVSINSAQPGGTFRVASGTSMAAPHVAGAFAALRSACPTVTLASIMARMVAAGPLIADNRPACPGGVGCPASLTRPAGSISRRRLQVDAALRNLRTAFPTACKLPTAHEAVELLLSDDP